MRDEPFWAIGVDLSLAASLAAIALFTCPSLFGLVFQICSRRPRGDLYQDADGKATPESAKAFSAKLPKSILLLAALTGAGTSIAVPVLTMLDKFQDDLFLENWLISGAWGLLFLQAVSITAIHNSPKAYSFGVWAFLSGLVLAYVLINRDGKIAEDLFANCRLVFGLRVAELTGLVFFCTFAVLLPRRPDVYYQDEMVDRMYTTSAYSRFTFSWPNSIIRKSTRKHNLDLADLPRPDHYTRSQDTSAAWKTHKYPVKNLWVSIARAHGFAFALQWILTFGTAILNFAPQWVILQLLRILETRQKGDPLNADIWIMVLWLGAAIIAQSLLESYVFWLSWAELCIPVRAQLSALIFEKAMRRKDVKSGKRATKESTSSDEASAADDEDEDEVETRKTKQGTVNLIGVDGKRVADFCSFQNLFPGSLFKLLVSLTFLVQLLGWIPLAAGFSSMLLIMPFNIYYSKKYSAAQDQLMKLRDEKLAVVTEALQGIRQIKFSALEEQWEDKVGEVRERELKSVWNVFCFDTILITCWLTSPIALSAVCLVVYSLLNGELIPSVAFVSLGVFRALETTLSVVPELTTDLLDAWISVKRIEKYLSEPDIEKVAQDSDFIAFEHASIAWPSDEKLDASERFVLRDLNVSFPQGELSVISGKTGSGKSLMLAAILGEVDLLSGVMHVPQGLPIDERHDDKATPANWILPKSIAYIAQIPWIENATIKENITFGLPVDEERYRKTVHVCALTKDLEMLSDGEDTEIGANGINLSGGQKWRITLARAIYSRAGILVMDDIFSAVDAHVGRHIFEQCLNGELCAGRTRILVTHHVALCAPKTKFLVELGEGGVAHAGLLAELAQDGTLDRIKSHEQSAEEINEDETADATAVNSDNSTDNDEEAVEAGASDGGALKKVPSKAVSISRKPGQKARKFVEEEKREEGAVRKHVYAEYLRASGGFFFWFFALVFFLFIEATYIGRSWWLRVWTGHDEQIEGTGFNMSLFGQQSIGQQSVMQPFLAQQFTRVFDYAAAGLAPGAASEQGIHLPDVHLPDVHLPEVHMPEIHLPEIHVSQDTLFYMSIYVVLALVSALFGSLRYFYVYFGSLKASRQLFAKLNFIILRSPLRWLDTVPVGRILNRFTADFNIIDSQMANSINFGASSLIHVVGVVVAGLIVSSSIVVLSLVLLVVCTYFAVLYIAAVRPVKRLESTAKSPVFEQFGTALAGVATIRGFDKSRVYIERMYRRLDDWSTTTWHMMLFNRWVGWRMSLMGSIYSVVVAGIVLLTPDMDSALAGFALSYALDFSGCVMWAVRLYANVELQMNAAERIIEYTELSTESLEGAEPPAAWPTEGRIEVEGLVVGYAADLPPVLKGLTFSVERSQRVGVVGRTGAGKSSLTLALFRFLEARAGSIHVDGIDISTIKLHALRSRLAIIPQDPVLFSGTIRTNLDPFEEHTDAELRDCLERVHLTTPDAESLSSTNSTSSTGHNTNVFDDLQSPVAEGGLNLSQGQRQLLCLARAIVRRPRVMVLDEATSAVDMHTDALIQRSIREEFTGATLLVIAHRLSTIADFDRILVLQDGAVAEFGSPRELWAKGEAGIFRGMCEESGERDKLEKVVMGE